MNKVRTAKVRLVAGLAVTILVIGFVALLVMRRSAGHGLGLGRFVSLSRAVIESRSVSSYSHGDFTNVIFLHHSTGRNLIEQGQVRERFTQAGYSFWDHDYDYMGLRGPTGKWTGQSYNIPDDNTDPDGLAKVFAQKVYGVPVNALSGLFQHEVIVFKSCFPVSNISGDEQLERFKSYYLGMRNVMDKHRDKLFIVVTPPPLNPAETDLQAAARARRFANWLNSDEYLGGHPNVATFDLFNTLAEDDPASPERNMLRHAYREGADSHPIRLANETVGSSFADFIIGAAQRYRTVYATSASLSEGTR